MNPIRSLVRTPNRRIAMLALLVLGLDQLTKALVLRFLGFEDERVVVPGFFKFVHWGNTGAAWSLFRGNNGLLAIVALVALAALLLVLYCNRRQSDSRTLLAQVAFGLIIGGIMGNLVDRIWRQHVIDFLYFYHGDIGFPAFNVADSAICTGVGLMFLLTFRTERAAKSAQPSTSE